MVMVGAYFPKALGRLERAGVVESGTRFSWISLRARARSAYCSKVSSYVMRITSRAGLAVLGIAAATSASGYVQTEIKDAEGNAIPGFSLEDFSDTGGDEIARKRTG